MEKGFEEDVGGLVSPKKHPKLRHRQTHPSFQRNFKVRKRWLFEQKVDIHAEHIVHVYP